jgi:hypothetical protein
VADAGQPAPTSPGGDASAPPAAPGGDTTKPAGAGMGDGTATAAPSTGSDTIAVALTMQDGKPMATVQQGTGGTQVEMKEGEVPAGLVTALKGAHDAMVAAGQHPKVSITGPLEVPFDTVVIPAVRAAIRAGFQRTDVEYKPQTSK